MSACQLGKGRNCREGVPHTQGNWRIFEQPEIFRMCQPLFAGTPAPTGSLLPLALQITCGSGRARE
jgi:hypothetical protein